MIITVVALSVHTEGSVNWGCAVSELILPVISHPFHYYK